MVIDGLYEPLYKDGDTLVNGEGHEIKILAIVADQYMYEDWDNEINPCYEFCNVIDYWYTTRQKYSDWVKPLNERLNRLHEHHIEHE